MLHVKRLCPALRPTRRRFARYPGVTNFVSLGAPLHVCRVHGSRRRSLQCPQPGLNSRRTSTTAFPSFVGRMPAKSVKFHRPTGGFPRDRDPDLQGVCLLSHSLASPARGRGWHNLDRWMQASNPWLAGPPPGHTRGQTSCVPGPTSCLRWQTRNSAERISFEGLLICYWSRRISSTNLAVTSHSCA